jgi:hypothetical protein
MEFISQLQSPTTQDEIDFQRIADKIIEQDSGKIPLLLNILAGSVRRRAIKASDPYILGKKYLKIVLLSEQIQSELEGEIKCPIKESLQLEMKDRSS